MRPGYALLAAALLGAGVLWAGTGTSLSGWTTASVANQTNSAAGASLAFTHTYPAGTCTTTARGSGALACNGSPWPTATITAGGVAAADAISNDGTLTAAQLVSELRATSCAPVRLANATTASDPMLPRYAATFRQADPWGGTGAVTLGTGGYAADVQATSTATLLGGSYSLGVWFKVANGYAAGGPLMSLSVSPVDGTSAAGSPLLWMDTAGKIRFRVTGTLGTSASGVSAAAYNDGSWHFAVLSISAVIVSTPTLYVDSASGVAALGLAALSGGNAYWHLGWGDFTGVSGAPATTLAGSLAGAYVAGSATSSGTRTSLYGAASASAYAAAVQALSGSAQLWMLDDPGTTTYTGSLPVIGATAACTMADVAWTTTTPSGTVAGAGTKLSAFADGTWHAVTAPAPGGTQTSTVTVSRDATWNAYVAGLRLYVPTEHRVQAAPAGGPWTRTFSWSGPTAAVIG
ncbi:MAG: LamG-like jellyroll fold domain-containing protein [Marmoricola sp.]